MGRRLGAFLLLLSRCFGILKGAVSQSIFAESWGGSAAFLRYQHLSQKGSNSALIKKCKTCVVNPASELQAVFFYLSLSPELLVPVADTAFYLFLLLFLSPSLSAVKNVGMEVVHIDLLKRYYLLCALCSELKARFALHRCKEQNPRGRTVFAQNGVSTSNKDSVVEFVVEIPWTTNAGTFGDNHVRQM